MRLRSRLTWRLLALAVACFKVWSAEIPSEAWFRPPPLQQPALSPDGRQVAALATGTKGTELWILSLAQTDAPRRVRTPDGNRVVTDFVWADRQDLVFLAQNETGAGEFWAVLPDGTRPRPLTTNPEVAFVRFLRPQPPAPGGVFLEGFPRNGRTAGPPGRWLDVLRVEPRSGRVTCVARNPGDVVEWLVDGAGIARVALAVRDGRQELRVREWPVSSAGRDRWRTATTFDVVREPAALRGLAPDGTRAWVAAYLGRDTLGLHEFDVRAGRFTKTRVANDRFDVNGRLWLQGDTPLAQTWDALKPHTYWSDPRWTARAKQLEAETPATVWRPASFATGDETAVFEAINSREPARLFVVHRDETRAPHEVMSTDSSPPLVGVRMEVVQYVARDGLVLSGYLTRSNPTLHRSPLIVLVHGGPWDRDVWGWQPEVQFLAARGWAVLQVNYRGSAGFGRQFQQAGAGAWEGAVTADLVDGARWAVAQQIADPTRVAIAGASFGGRLTLTGLTQAPELFRAGASVGGAFDLAAWLQYAGRSQLNSVTATQRHWLGDTSPEDSWRPRSVLAKLGSPLLLLHAVDDSVVPFTQSAALAATARTIGAPVTLSPLARGGHALGSPDQQAEVWIQVEEFLTRSVTKISEN